MTSLRRRACVGPTLVLLLAAASPSQTCATGRLIKNDILPGAPSGPFRFAVVPGLCNNEAAMSIFATGGPAKVHQVSILFANGTGTNGVKALVDVEIYDGVTEAPSGKYSLGKLVYKLSSGGSNLQIQSNGINTFKLPKPVSITSGKLVVGFRMLQNLSAGSCTLGYATNFSVDANGKCTKGQNILDATGHGPIDPAIYRGFPLPLCPLFFNGSWVIRACVTNTSTVTWTGNPTPGGFVSLRFVAPTQSGSNYFALVGGGIKTGFVTPWGKLPLDPDPLFNCFLGDCRASVLLGGAGVISAKGDAFGALRIPNLAILRNSGLTMYVSFFTHPAVNFFNWKVISGPSKPIVVN